MIKKRRILLVLLSALFVSIGMMAEATTLRKGPYLIYPDTNTEMSVLWQTENTSSSSYLEWGTTTSYGNSSGALTETGEHQFNYKITGLTPGTRYYYRLTVDSQQVESSFMAAPANNATSVTLYGYGDTITNTGDQNKVTGQLLADVDVDPNARQTLVLFTGDWNGDDSEGDWDNQFFNRSYNNNLDVMSRMAYMGARGNHEGAATELKKYWPYAGDDYHYSYDYGPIHVIVIDQYIGFTPGTTQYNWIVNDLASSTKPFKIAVYHAPAWSAGGHKDESKQLAAQNYLQPLFEQYGVKLVVNGHNHYYARALVNGVNHMTTGGGGAPLYDPNNNEAYIVKTSKSLHFCRFEADGDTLTTTVVKDNGTVIETFQVSAITYAPNPVAVDDSYDTPPDTLLNIAAPGILGNDSDPQNDPITAVLDSNVSNGTLTLNNNGSFVYTPNAGFSGTDSFTYHANDSLDDSNIATVTITVSSIAGGTPGLLYGELSGNMNTTDPNPQTSITVDLSETEDSISDNTTEVYTGEIYDADGHISFTENIDDKVSLWIDGILVLSDDGWNIRTSTSDLNLTPGWHTFELRISNGGGGSGPVSSPGFGYDMNGGTTWVHPEDPGDGSLFRTSGGD